MPKHSLGRSPSIPLSWSSLHLTPSRQSHLGEISFSQQRKGTTSEHTTTHCTPAPYRTPAQGGKVTSTGHSADQYWSQREVVVVDISYQYWSLRRPVLVRIPPPLLVVVAFRYSYTDDRHRLRHHPTARREKQPILVGGLTYIAPTTKLYRSR